MNFKSFFCVVYLLLSGGFVMAQSLPSSPYAALFVCDTDIQGASELCN